MDHVEIRLLGAPTVLVNGQAVHFRSRKEMALLIYLVVEGGWLRREQIIDRFWPQSDRVRGQASLRNSLLRLRQGLGRSAACLQIEPTVVRFDPTYPHTLDLTANQVGGEFLAGFGLDDAPEFDHWVQQQREQWRERQAGDFERLVQQQVDGGQLEAALSTVRRWLTQDRLNERAYRRQIELYALTGNRSAALQAYEHCRQLLAAELGVEPEPATRALVARIKQDKVTRTPDPPLTLPPPHLVTLSPSLLVLPFVGRTAEEQQLRQLYQTAGQGKPHVAVLIGDAGMGKSRLAERFLAWAMLQAADILSGRALEAGGQLPYQPVVAALRSRLERENAPDDLLPDIWLTELSQLLPELRDRYPDLPLPDATDPAVARPRLFEALARCLQALSAPQGRPQPLVLWIDDLQWADAATLELLPYLCRRWCETQTPILLLLTLRQENLLTTPDLRHWLTQLEREILLTRLALSPLSSTAIQQLVTMLAGGAAGQLDARPDAPHTAVAQWLSAETGGQPFFVAETLKLFIEQKWLSATVEAEQWRLDFGPAITQINQRQTLPIPPTVREVILARLGRLSAAASALLAAEAVLGRASSFELLCQVAGLEELTALPALDELLTSQLLLEAANQRQPYTFAHDKIRDVVYTEAGDARRRVYHRRALSALEGVNSPAAELAHHALAARLPEPALRYSIAAGDAAAAVYAHSEAIAHYQRAVEVLQNDPPAEAPAGATLAHLYLHLGRTFELSAHYDQALVVYRQLAEQAQQRNDPPLQLAALLAQITPLATVNSVFDPAQSEIVAEQALALARTCHDPAAEAKIQWNRLILYRNTNQLARAVVAGEAALQLIRQQAATEQLPFILHDLGYCFAFMADFPRANAAFAEAIPLWRAAGNLPMLGDSLTGLCYVASLTGAYDHAITSFTEALQISERINSEWGLAGCRHNIGLVFAERGEFQRAIDEMEESIRRSEVLGFRSALIVVQADLALLYADLGEVAHGLTLARQAVQEAETKLPIFRLYALAALAHTLVAAGEVTEAAAIIELMTQEPNRAALGIYPMLHGLAAGEVALAQGQSDQAAALLTETIFVIRQLGAQTFLPAALFLHGQVLLAAGQIEKAKACWLEARSVAETIGAQRRLWQILLALSGVTAEPAVAAQLRQQAQTVVTFIADQTPSHLRQRLLTLSAV